MRLLVLLIFLLLSSISYSQIVTNTNVPYSAATRISTQEYDTLSLMDCIVVCNSNAHYTNFYLPSAVANLGKVYYLKYTAGQGFSVYPVVGGQQIEGGISLDIFNSGATIMLFSDGAAWWLGTVYLYP